MAHKICPKCQSPAPLEATFCGQCGRQYKTQFVPAPETAQLDARATIASVPDTSQPRSVLTPNTEHLTPNTQRSTPNYRAAIVLMAVVVAVLILILDHRGKTGGYNIQATRSIDRPMPPPQAPPDANAADMVKHGDDPIEEEAKRVLERDNAQLQTAPPPGTVGPDGRIHLRGGGSVTREQWDDANRRLRNSPQFRDPMPPPPVN